jgi:uncharacterized SAM-binding protein YcdF (DUF218 family)
MFFTLSKLFWFVINPANMILVALSAGVVLSFGRFRKTGIWLLRIAAAAALVIAIVPFGTYVNRQLENRFPADPVLPEKIAGIVILGGVIDPTLSRQRGRPQIGGAVERLTVGAALAHRFPDAKVIYTGGSGDLFNPEAREAPFAAPLFTQLGLGLGRVIYEDQARNTFENATRSKAIANPAPGENWILVTSAFHMPRAVGVFRKADWPVIPYPVDFDAAADAMPQFRFSLVGGFSSLNAALREVIGLAAYRLTGKTDAWFPAPAT